MNTFKKFAKSSLLIIAVSFLSGCAAGAATAGYSLRSVTADSLSPQAEQRIVERTKREMYFELCENGPHRECEYR